MWDSINFPLLLVVAVVVSGVLALIGRSVLAPRRKRAVQAEMARGTVADPKKIEALQHVSAWEEYATSLFPVFLLVLVLRSFLGEPFQIPSESMLPTLERGDFILTSKFSYGIRLPVLDRKILDVGHPERGDVLVFKYPVDPSINYIKRVVGLPGDRVRFTQDKRLFINDQEVQRTLVGELPGSLGTTMVYRETLGKHEHLIYQNTAPSALGVDREWQVPEGYYFVMGDNRDNSKDSRFWVNPSVPPELQAMVPDANVIGKAFMVWMHWEAPIWSNFPSLSRSGFID